MTRARLSTSVEALRADVDIQDALALSLPVAIQEAVDIAFHIAGRQARRDGDRCDRRPGRGPEAPVRGAVRLRLRTWDDA